HIDILLCRNVLIYFDAALQERILARFHYAIREGGYLFLGKSESLLSRSRRFGAVDARWRIFERLAGGSIDRTLSSPETTYDQVTAQTRREAAAPMFRTKGIVESLRTAIMVIDPQDGVMIWNPAAEALYEVPADAA